MAYFPNGASGDHYEERYCLRCVHLDGKDGMGCPVWNLHKDAGFLKVPRVVLDALIPMDADRVYPEECAMFVEAPENPDSIDARFPESVHPAYRKPKAT